MVSLVHGDQGCRWAFAEEVGRGRVIARREGVVMAEAGDMKGVTLRAARRLDAGEVALRASPIACVMVSECERPSARLFGLVGDLAELEGSDKADKLRRNGHSIVDDELREIGIGLYPRIATAANHSCCPNIWPRFDGTTLEYVALRRIAKDEELRHEYKDSAGVDRDFQDFGFRCGCAKCFAKCADDVPRRDRVELREAREAAERAIEARDFFQAAIALRAIKIRRFYAEFHPLVGLHHLRLAKVLVAINDADAAAYHAGLAAEALAVSHGKGSRLHAIATRILLEKNDEESL